MVLETKETTVAYRCPHCGTATYGFAGRFALHAGLVRLKCSCGGSALDIRPAGERKLSLSIPCVYCGKNHAFTVSDAPLFDRDLFLLPCPYSGMEIGFFGKRENVDRAVEEGGEKLQKLMTELHVDSVRDLQPQDMEEDEVLPDPTAYDCIRFLVRDLEEEGKIDCKCHIGTGYDLRFIKGGIEVFCPTCGATREFHVDSGSSAEGYLDTDRIELT